MTRKIGTFFVIVGIIAIFVGVLFIAKEGDLLRVLTTTVIGGFMTVLIGLYIR